MKTPRKEAQLLGYRLLYDRSGKLVTERTDTDITTLKKYFSVEEFNTLNTVIRETKTKLDAIHHYVEASLNCRKMSD
jgi:hypothetical protein